MAKGAYLTKQVKILIAEIHLSHPDWGATKLRECLLQELKSLGLNRNFGPDWPSVSAVQKELMGIRKNIDEKSTELTELDSPFSLGVLGKHPIPPEALPLIMRVWANRLEAGKPDKDGFSFKVDFTTREALWVARLSHLDKDPETVYEWAFWYAHMEPAYEAIGEHFETAEIDSKILENFKPTTAESKRKRKGGSK